MDDGALNPANRRIYIIRHAQSKWNAATAEERETDLKKSSPTLRDAGLSTLGLEQLESAKKIVSRLEIDVIYCSPLTRALQTAHALGDKKIPIITATFLREIRRDVSDLGQNPDALKTCFPIQAIGLTPGWWMEPDCPCPETKECGQCVTKRIGQIITLIRSEKRNMLIVAHSDLLLEMSGWEAKNAEIARVRLSL